MVRAFFLVLVGLTLALVLRALAALTRRGTPRPTHAPGAALPAVRCARCGVFVAVPDALVADGQRYCSTRCAEPGGDGR